MSNLMTLELRGSYESGANGRSRESRATQRAQAAHVERWRERAYKACEIDAGVAELAASLRHEAAVAELRAAAAREAAAPVPR